MAEAKKKAIVGNGNFTTSESTEGVILNDMEEVVLFSDLEKDPGVWDRALRSIKRSYTPVTGGWLTTNRTTGEKKERWSGTNAVYYVDLRKSLRFKQIISVLLRPSNMTMTITYPQSKGGEARKSTEYVVILADSPVDVAAYRKQFDLWSRVPLRSTTLRVTNETAVEVVNPDTKFRNSCFDYSNVEARNYNRDLTKFVKCIVPEKCNGSTLVFSVPTGGETNSNFQVKIKWTSEPSITRMDTKNLIVGIKAATDAAIKIINDNDNTDDAYYRIPSTGGITTVTSNPDPIDMSIGRSIPSREDPGDPPVRAMDQWHRTRSQHALALFHAALLLSEVAFSNANQLIDSTFGVWRGGKYHTPE